MQPWSRLAEVQADRRLTARDRQVYEAIADAADPFGICKLSQAALARVSNISPATFNKCVRRLEKLEYIFLLYRGGVSYELLLHKTIDYYRAVKFSRLCNEGR